MAAGAHSRVIVPRRLQRPGQPAARRALIALLIVIVATFLAFSKSLPWQQPFEFKAVFESAANNCGSTRPCGSPASKVGEVTRSSAWTDSDLVEVTMEIEGRGPADPQGRDAKIRSAHLPRGQLLRRPDARHAERARARRRRHDPGHPDRVRRCSSTSS